MSKRKSTLPEKAAKQARICCPFCTDTFKYAGDMVRHQGVKHTDKLPHPCKQCYRAYASDGELATHVHEALYVRSLPRAIRDARNKSKILYRNGYEVVYIWESTYYRYLKNPDDLLAHCYTYQGKDFLVVQ